MLDLGGLIRTLSEKLSQANVRYALIGGIDVIWARRQYSLDMLKGRILTADGIHVAGPEAIIGLKVQAIANAPERRASDMSDIEWLLRAHFKTMDMVRVREYFALFMMEADLDELLRRVGYVK